MATKYVKKKDRNQVEHKVSDLIQDSGSYVNQDGELVFFRAAGGSNSPAAAKYTIPPAELTLSPATGGMLSAAAAEPFPQSLGPRAAGEASPQPLQKCSPAPAPTSSPLLLKLLALYAKTLASGSEGVTRICHYQGLYGLASSFHALPDEVKQIIKKSSPSRWERDVVVAYGYKVLMGDV